MARRRKSRERQKREEALRRLAEAEIELAACLIDSDFSPDMKLEWRRGGTWPRSRSGYRVQEEVLQTLLWLHTEQICGEPIRIFAKGGRQRDMADMIGLDGLGRVHLFELKRDKVTATTARQLEQYLLGYLFRDVSLLTDEWRVRIPDLLSDGRDGLLVSLAGAHAGVRSDNKGRKLVAKVVALENREEAKRIRQGRVWRDTSAEQQVTLVVQALLTRARKKRRLPPEACPTLEVLRAQHQQWCARLDPTHILNAPRPRLRRPAVVWLVAPRVEGEARERIRLWRRAGLDARWLEMAAFALNRKPGWELHVAREHAPQRSAVAGEAAQWLETLADQASEILLDTHFYAVRPASNSDVEDDVEGGRLLHRCRVTARGANGKFTFSADSAS